MGNQTINRLKLALAGHIYGQAITIAMQFVMPTIFVRELGLENFGRLISIQSYGLVFSLIEAGIIQGMLNYTLIDRVKNKSSEDLNTIQKTVNKILLNRLIAVLLIIIFCNALVAAFSSSVTAVKYCRLASLAGFTTALCSLATLFAASETSLGRDGLGTVINNTLRLLDASAAAIGALWLHSVEAVVLGIFFSRLATTLIIECVIFHRCKSAPYLLEKKSTKRIKRIGRAFAISSLGTQLVPNFLPALLSLAIPPAGLAVYSLSKTLSRVPVQITAMLAGAIGPQFSRYFAEDNRPQLKRLWQAFCVFSAFVSIVFTVFALGELPTIERIWLHRTEVISKDILAIMLVSAFSVSVSNACTNALSFTNHTRFLELSGILIPVFALAGTAFGASVFGIRGAAYCSAGTDITVLMLCLVYAFRKFHD